ncbi:MAG: hypothetical protein PHV52_07205 [Aliarcobacter sp.]|jgi:hypothetical protein|nr:hypothetical protein [Aliarcobacter sp.]
MAIKLFTFILLLLSLGAYFIPVENLKKTLVNKDTPLVVFEDALMYTIDENSINRLVFATHAIKYKNRDEMYNADILLKNLDDTKNFESEKLKADLIVKKGDNYTLINNVKYTRDDFIKLNTNELFYDDIKKIAQNTKPFDAIYNNHFVKGNSVYLDINNEFVKAKNTHFEIDVTKKN